MSHSPNLLSYVDVAEVLAAFTPGQEQVVHFSSKPEAIAWRHRLYTYRKLLQQESQALQHSDNPEDRIRAGTTPYDLLKVSVEGTTIILREITVPRFEFRPKLPIGATIDVTLDSVEFDDLTIHRGTVTVESPHGEGWNIHAIYIGNFQIVGALFEHLYDVLMAAKWFEEAVVERSREVRNLA